MPWFAKQWVSEVGMRTIANRFAVRDPVTTTGLSAALQRVLDARREVQKHQECDIMPVPDTDRTDD